MDNCYILKRDRISRQETHMKPLQAYEALALHSKETTCLASTIGVLNWDQRTQIPSKGHATRAEQLAFLEKMLHQRMTDPKIGEWLSDLEGSDLVDDPLCVEAVNVREWRRAYDRQTKIPETLAVELARCKAEAQAAWEVARPTNDWPMFEPHLERTVSLRREKAQALGFENEPYDALLEDYEQGETAENIEPTFKLLADALVKLLERIKGASKTPRKSLAGLKFSVAAQESFGTEVAKRLGYDMQGGRLDVSSHPFTSGIGPGDVRITTRYNENDFTQAFFSTLHEAGHAMHHQGLPLEHWGTPFCSSISLGIGESQSRLWENMVARSPAFWKYFFPLARERFGLPRDLSAEDFLLEVNQVKPGLIRVDADEVTYNLHILMRFGLERDLTRGDLTVADAPEAWNNTSEEYLGITAPDYASGIMQDIHWSAGAVGYFPTYTLGNLYAAQFFAAAQRALGDLDNDMAEGDFSGLLEWLRTNIHRQGRRYKPRDLVRVVTGEDLNPQYFIDYLETKYGEIYGL
jgi:carboxypeptidase Taq